MLQYCSATMHIWLFIPDKMMNKCQFVAFFLIIIAHAIFFLPDRQRYTASNTNPKTELETIKGYFKANKKGYGNGYKSWNGVYGVEDENTLIDMRV